MAESIKHHGPDNGGYALLSENPELCSFQSYDKSSTLPESFYAGFAHRRLTVIDISDSGIQPMSNKTRNRLCHNGNRMV